MNSATRIVLEMLMEARRIRRRRARTRKKEEAG